MTPRTAAVQVLAGAPLPTDPIAVLLQGGVLGIVVLLLLTRRLVTGPELDRVIAERDSAHAELAALRARMDDEVIPALTRLADAAVNRRTR